MTAPKAISILSVPVHDITAAETLARIGEFVASREPHQLCTVNTEFVMAAQSDPDFMAILRDADLCLPDAAGILWASRLLGTPLRERVAGSDLVPAIAGAAAAHGWRLFLLGAAEGVADRAASILQSRHPNLIVAGAFAGSPHPDHDEATIARIRAARPDVLLVAYGAPAQDKWIARNRHRLRAPLMMGVGGAFDFIAGVAVRAPRPVQRLGLEWLHRLIQQPWRWRRMLALPKFAWAVLASRLRKF